MIRKRILGLALIALLSQPLCASTRAQGVRLYPVDEASKDPSFKRFRDRLKAALKRRDRTHLLSILDKRILNSLGGDRGIEEFVEKWKLNTRNSKVWGELWTVLSMGGSFGEENGQKIFEAPYVSSRWNTIQGKLPGEFGEVPHEAIIGTNVRVRSRADSDAPVIALLSYDVVQVDYEGSVFEDANHERFRWVKIKLKGKDGYVPGHQIRSPSDLGAYFKKIRGRWVMYIFAGGE